MIQSDFKTYRVEEFFEGKNLSHLELQEDKVIEQAMRKIAEFHYDPELNSLKPRDQIKVRDIQLVDDRENGWYWRG